MKLTRANRTTKGGNGAAEYGVSTYGAAGEQVAQNGSGNLIATTSGGSRRRSCRRKKGGNFTKVAVPAALLYANQFLGKRSASSFKAKSYKGGSKRVKSMRKRHKTFRRR